jgi:hypothetical protein
MSSKRYSRNLCRTEKITRRTPISFLHEEKRFCFYSHPELSSLLTTQMRHAIQAANDILCTSALHHSRALSHSERLFDLGLRNAYSLSLQATLDNF